MAGGSFGCDDYPLLFDGYDEFPMYPINEALASPDDGSEKEKEV